MQQLVDWADLSKNLIGQGVFWLLIDTRNQFMDQLRRICAEKTAVDVLWLDSDGRASPAEASTLPSQALGQASDELARLRLALRQARAEIAELRLLADQDALTGLPNRRRLMDEIALAVERRQRHGLPAVLAFIDMDGLKGLNDRYGHRTGDAAIIEVARIIRDSLGDGFAARLGGDEFALILHGVEAKEGALRLQQIATRVMTAPLWVDNHCHILSVSVGVTSIDADARPGTLLARADAAMYADKRRNQAAARSAR